tara:strand:+ start:3035 stop:3403 length:369 start_codon:yes stop_codon:yes gene_type:complete
MIMRDSDRTTNDYEYSREVLFDLIEKGRGALEDMIEVARESEHPRAFEVLSGLMKNTADINDKLLDLNKKHKDINVKDEPKAIGQTTNNLFVGSTTDLQRMLQQNKRENNVVDITPRLNDKE